MARRHRDSLLASLPPPWPDRVLPEIQEAAQAAKRTIVVLDDDPTGTQTVYDVPVLTDWDISLLERELRSAIPLFFILTNSRSFPPDVAKQIAKEAGANLEKASQASDRSYAVISRSDSTLRGHYPDEVDALAGALGMQEAPLLLIPFFEEGGRITVDDIHWVADGEFLVPAGKTPFAWDVSFGYEASNLCEWVEEKTNGRIPAKEVRAVSIDEIRSGGPETVANRLSSLPPKSVCVVNAAVMRDLEVVALGCLKAEAGGRRLLYRTGASFVSAYAGLAPRPLLTPEILGLPERGAGLVVVGSHVPLTTRQLNHQLHHIQISPIKLNVSALLDSASEHDEVERVGLEVQSNLGKGLDTVLFTSRELVAGKSPEDSLRIARAVSAGLVSVIEKLEARPRYMIVKGGITSSDIATQSLCVHRAMVMGQIIPGVPVHRHGGESRFPGMAYVIFPGNVGGDDALTNVVRSLSST